ncbi:MAG: uroporphyrinogen decarboxylase family protein [Eubacteriales bacterium]|nr:uroporphyrinogen decarboxylase family protein [Eubacteriales bacterium]
MTTKMMYENLLAGGTNDRPMVNPHWWGCFKYQHAGIMSDYDVICGPWPQTAEEYAAVEMKFFEDYNLDMFHLGGGTPEIYDDDKYRREELTRLSAAVRRLESKRDLDEFAALLFHTPDEIIASGAYDHIKLISDRYGDTVPVFYNNANQTSAIFDPYGYFGYEDALCNLLEKPDMMEYFTYRLYEESFVYMEALRKIGCFGYIASECLCAADTMSPKTYREIIFGAQKMFFERAAKLGLSMIVYYCGDVMPILEDIKMLGVPAIMVEESKKTCRLDIAELYAALEGSMILFGNVDGVGTLLMGTPGDVKRETEKQLRAAGGGCRYFVSATGSPIAFDTPPENLRMFIETSKNFKG